MPVVVVRHTRLAVQPGICYGITDVDVASTFATDAAAVAEKILHCDTLVTSPLQRCRKLAGKLAQRFDVPIGVDKRLSEIDFGSWECQPWSDIPRTELDAWAGDFLHAVPHGGESVAALRKRALAVVADYRAQPGTHIIVSHSGVIRALLASGDRSEDFDATPGFGEAIELKSTSG